MSKSDSAAKLQGNLQELLPTNLAPGDAYIRFQLTTEIAQNLDSSFTPYPPYSPLTSAKDGISMTSRMTFLLSMEQVQESLVIETERITPLPNMPQSVIGIMTTHNQVFCVFDLAQLLQLHSHPISLQQYQIIVLKTVSKKPIHIGLAVSQLQGILRFPQAKIQSSLTGFSAQITPYLCGAVPEQETMIPILEFNLVLKALTDLNHP